MRQRYAPMPNGLLSLRTCAVKETQYVRSAEKPALGLVLMGVDAPASVIQQSRRAAHHYDAKNKGDDNE